MAARTKARRTKTRGPVSRPKAKQIMKEGAIGGKDLTKKQEGLFGLVAGGETPTRPEKPKKSQLGKGRDNATAKKYQRS